MAALKQTAKTQPKAAYDLGLRYFRGDGVRQDSYQALKWMREAAERGDLNAQKALLGLRYFRGDGVRQDSYQALKWMREAAERGDLNAQKALGSFYLFGLEEMGSDAREAEKWLSIAAGRGDKESKKLLDLARKAKKEDEEDWKWRTQWRDVYYGYWYSGYPYYGVWQQTYWYY
nr:tetratricopeptide repeat protein [Burkholderia semiarida]